MIISGEHKRKILNLPLSAFDAEALRAGDLLFLNGVVYIARDAAHKKMVECMEQKKPLPFDLANSSIYYAGPCPAKPDQVIGSIGPTTSGRMDAYSPLLLQQGLKIMIGKGQRSEAVVEAIKQYKALYLGATGGAGALLAQCVVEAEIIAYPELGAEAIRRLQIRNFPAIVLIDSLGNNLYNKEK